MDEHLSASSKTLLGRYLLGQATDAEEEELQQRGVQSPELHQAMELLDRSGLGFDESPLGAELGVGSTPLPDYRQPERLARSLRRWNRIGTALCAVSIVLLLALSALALVRLGSGLPASQIAILTVASASGLIAVLLVLAKRRHRAPYAGAPWAELVAHIELQRSRYGSPGVATAMIVSATLSPLTLILSGFAPKPLGVPLAYVSLAAMAYAIHVAVRRWRLRTIGDV